MTSNSEEKWILREFGKKSKKSKVPIGTAYQANIPDLICEKCSLNSAKENEMKTTSIYLKYQVGLKTISIHLKKLTESEIEFKKRNLLKPKSAKIQMINRKISKKL